jgi:PhzF family phenazine biosynthesis protein
MEEYMAIDLYIVDSFTDTLFRGNPAAVCVLKEWLPDETLQKIARENNLSETAFFVAQEQQPLLRWFTPKAEIDLCGHATLAAGSVALSFLRPKDSQITFNSQSGPLIVSRSKGGFTLEFPRRDPEVVDAPEALFEALGITKGTVLYARDWFVVLDSEEEVAAIRPNLSLLRELDGLGVVVTAPGRRSDFVSRAFFPKIGIDEDPVTGATHCALTPYWSERLGKSNLFARQLSERGGEITCQLKERTVLLSGETRLFSRGEIIL